jgi:hypothetical protein
MVVSHTRPTISYKDDIIFANRITYRSSTSQNLLENKSHLVLAITFEILALYINLVTTGKSIAVLHPRPTTGYVLDIIL